MAGGTPTGLPSLAASVLTCSSAGFFALHLWVLVKHRAAQRGAIAILQYTLLLVVYGVGSYRNIQVAARSSLARGAGGGGCAVRACAWQLPPTHPHACPPARTPARIRPPPCPPARLS